MLRPGTYENARRWPFHGFLSAFHATFEQHCEFEKPATEHILVIDEDHAYRATRRELTGRVVS